MILVFVAILAALPARPFSEERQLLDRRLETLRRILPDGPNPAADAAVVRELGEKAGLARVELQTRPPVEAGPRGEVLVEVSGLGRFVDVDRFFRQAALHYRLVDVDRVVVTAAQADVVKMTAVLKLPYRPAKAPLPPPPDGTRSRLPGVPKAQADAFVRDQALALAKSEWVAQLRRNRRNPRLFLSEISAIARDRPVTLSFASFGDDFTIRGITVGEGPARALESRFERGFFRVSEFLMARQGACHRFEVKGQCPVAGTEAELPLPSEDPFAQDETPCRVDRDDATRSWSVKPPNPKATSGKGQLTLRLREVDVADVFRVLNLLSGVGFIVDGDVSGRMTVDVSKLTLDETLDTLEKSGLDITDSGPVRRVSLGRPGKSKATAAPGGGTAATFALKRADVREILAAMTDMDPTLAALGPEGFLGRASVWATDVSVIDLRAALLDAAGLSERFEEGRRIVERKPGAEEKLVPVSGTPPERRLILRPEDLTVLEFDVAGVASAGTTWIAFAYAPTGTLNAYRVGDRLADGVVKQVEATDVQIDTDEGPLHLPIASASR
jgi:hypothetical protein